MPAPVIKLLESPEEMSSVEDLQRIVWPGSETDIVPAHVFITAVHNGGLVIGAFDHNQQAAYIDVAPGCIRWEGPCSPNHNIAWEDAQNINANLIQCILLGVSE